MITIGVNNYMKDELLKGLTEEQIAKIKACKSQEELLSFAKEEGIQLSEEQLEAVSGGCTTPETKPIVCAGCGSDQVEKHYFRDAFFGETECTCKKCGKSWIL